MKDTAEIVKDFINQTHKSLFLTGKAGTGKTTLLNEIKKQTLKNTIVVAPTGIAALNAGGVTIHSMFQLPFATFIPDFSNGNQVVGNVKIESRDTLMRHFQMNKKRKELLKNTELLIIDEVSMLRADVLDAIDWVLRSIRKVNRPFGGIQVLFIGDLLQLPPVVKNEEWAILNKYYKGIFFFDALVLQENPPVYIELEKIYRQDDPKFIDILNHLRNNRLDEADKSYLNQFVNENFDSKKNPGYITLTTHNFKADQINQQELELIKEKKIQFDAEIKGDFPPHLFPIEEAFVIKKGAQVMFIKNDSSQEKLFYNGKMGVVKNLSQYEIIVEFPEEKKTIEVQKFEWENIKYSVDENTKEIKEEVIGTFVHYPLKLAWAITIHKSQGLTFEKAVIDISSTFAPGQAYVALSRLTSLKGLVLLKPFTINASQNNQNVIDYAQNKSSKDVLELVLNEASKDFLLEELKQSFDFGELSSKWRIHVSTYLKQSSKSEKAKHQDWAIRQSGKMEQLNEPGQKFHRQLANIIHAADFNVAFLQERVEAAYQFFFKQVDEVLFSNLKKLEEIIRVPKIKAYFEELKELDEILTTKVIQLKKSKMYLDTFKENKEFAKSSSWNNEMIEYKAVKIALAKQEIRSTKTMFEFVDEMSDSVEIKLTKSKSAAKPAKIHTTEITLEMFQAGLSVLDIAKKRLFTSSTIYNHLAQLIQKEKLEISEVLEAEKIKDLKEANLKFEENSISSIKEMLGDKFTYEELNLYKASLLM